MRNDASRSRSAISAASRAERLLASCAVIELNAAPIAATGDVMRSDIQAARPTPIAAHSRASADIRMRNRRAGAITAALLQVDGDDPRCALDRAERPNRVLRVCSDRGTRNAMR